MTKDSHRCSELKVATKDPFFQSFNNMNLKYDRNLKTYYCFNNKHTEEKFQKFFILNIHSYFTKFFIFKILVIFLTLLLSLISILGDKDLINHNEENSVNTIVINFMILGIILVFMLVIYIYIIKSINYHKKNSGIIDEKVPFIQSINKFIVLFFIIIILVLLIININYYMLLKIYNQVSSNIEINDNFISSFILNITSINTNDKTVYGYYNTNNTSLNNSLGIISFNDTNYLRKEYSDTSFYYFNTQVQIIEQLELNIVIYYLLLYFSFYIHKHSNNLVLIFIYLHNITTSIYYSIKLNRSMSNLLEKQILLTCLFVTTYYIKRIQVKRLLKFFISDKKQELIQEYFLFFFRKTETAVINVNKTDNRYNIIANEVFTQEFNQDFISNSKNIVINNENNGHESNISKDNSKYKRKSKYDCYKNINLLEINDNNDNNSFKNTGVAEKNKHNSTENYPILKFDENLISTNYNIRKSSIQDNDDALTKLNIFLSSFNYILDINNLESSNDKTLSDILSIESLFNKNNSFNSNNIKETFFTKDNLETEYNQENNNSKIKPSDTNMISIVTNLGNFSLFNGLNESKNRYYEIKIQKYYHDKNNLININIIFKEITEQVIFSNKNKKILEKQAAFSKSVHEFKTPLLTITSQLDTLNDKIMNNRDLEEIVDLSLLIKHLAHYTNFLILDIIEENNRSYSMNNNGDSTNIKQKENILMIETEDIISIKTDIILFNYQILNSLLNYSNHNKNIQSKLLFDDNLNNYCFNTNKTKFSQILINIISNSVKFTKKGSILLSCYLEKNKEMFLREEENTLKQNKLNKGFLEKQNKEVFINEFDYNKFDIKINEYVRDCITKNKSSGKSMVIESNKDSNKRFIYPDQSSINNIKDLNNTNNILKDKKYSDYKIQQLAIIKVIDTGKGMFQMELDSLCKGNPEKFKSNEIGNSMGTGLGMSIVKNICRIMNYEVSIYSEKDVGTIYTIKFLVNISDDIESPRIKNINKNITKDAIEACNPNNVKYNTYSINLCNQNSLRNNIISNSYINENKCNISQYYYQNSMNKNFKSLDLYYNSKNYSINSNNSENYGYKSSKKSSEYLSSSNRNQKTNNLQNNKLNNNSRPYNSNLLGENFRVNNNSLKQGKLINNSLFLL